MKCPRCSKLLKVMKANQVELNVCHGGCGGIWFDNFEIKKLDEQHEADHEFLATLQNAPTTRVNLEQRLNCPKCTNIVMLRNFFSVKKSVEVDHCGGCGGYWLDAGELIRINNEYATEEARNAAAKEVFDEMFGAELADMRRKSEAERATVKQISNALRFLCPSWYIPGKQDWGGH